MGDNLNFRVLKDSISNKKSVISVVGLGYVGLPLIKLFLKKGFRCFGFDIDEKKIEKLKNGREYIKHIDFSIFKDKYKKKKFFPTSDFRKFKEVDVIIICVPTPLYKRKPDLGYVKSTVKKIVKNFKKGTLIVLESTTYPGTTREVVLPVFEREGLIVGRDFFLAFSPEREDPGNKKFNTENIPKVVGGIDDKSRELAALLYSKIVDKVVEVNSTEIAEATKMLENTFRAVNIALVNELKIFFDKAGINIWDVIKASSTKPFGFMPFYPGPGWGGHCIPIDPFYLYWKAKEIGVELDFIRYAGEINTYMPYYVIEKLKAHLLKTGKKLNGSKILLLGVAYKKDIDDIRESPALVIFEILERKGASVSYFDPYVKNFVSERYKRNVKRVRNLKKAVKESDAVIILTDHSNINYNKILKDARIILDTRNVLPESERVIKA